MLKFINGKNSKLKYCVFISMVLHVIAVILVNSSFTIQRDRFLVKSENEKNKVVFIGLTSVNESSKQSMQSSNPSTQEKINNIKMLEKVPTISSKQSMQSSNPSTQEKINNIKMLEKVPTISSKQSMQSSNPSTQEKKSSVYTITNIEKNDVSIQKMLDIHKNNIDRLLDTLIQCKYTLKLNGNSNEKVNKKNSVGKNIEECSKEKFHKIDKYKKILIRSISERFYDDPSFSGKQCILCVKLLSDGTLSNIRSSDNCSPLCQAAISAVKLTKLPPPPNPEIYKIFENITLNFSS